MRGIHVFRFNNNFYRAMLCSVRLCDSRSTSASDRLSVCLISLRFGIFFTGWNTSKINSRLSRSKACNISETVQDSVLTSLAFRRSSDVGTSDWAVPAWDWILIAGQMVFL